MARSAFVEVNITNPTRLAQDSQDTANNAIKGVTDLNDPNLMSVIEKQNNIGRFAGLTSQFSVLIQNAKDDGIDTTAVTTAYNNLNRFMADILADPNHASDVDRVIYKKYQDAYNEELVNLQNALQNNTNNKFTSAASAISQAASTANVAKSAADSAYTYANSEIAVQSTATAKAQSVADNAFSQAQSVGSQASVEISKNSMATAKAQSAADNAFNKAQEVGNQASSEIAVQSEATAKAQNTADNAFSEAQSIGSQASSEIAVQSNATAKAQSTADSAFSQAVTAIDTGKATSQAVTALKDGSTLTIAQLGNGLASKVSNSEYASYKEQTASQIGQMVTNGAFSAYQQTTADLISAKVATKDFTAYQATTAKSIDSKVESSDFNTYKTQTAGMISEKVSNSEYASNKEQTASQIADRVSNSAFSTYQEQTASQFASKVDNGDFTTYKTQTADLISARVATKDFKAYQDTTAKAISSKVESNDFNTYKTQTANLINDKVSSAKYTSDKTQTDKDIASKVSSDDFSTYKTQTNELIGSKVSNGDFSTYKTQTAGLISAKVETKDFSSYKDETAKAISSKVESKDFNTYKTQTADALQTLVSKSPSNIIKDGGFNSATIGQVPSGWTLSTLGKIVANPDTASNLVATGHPVLQINSQISGNSDIYYGDWFDVQPGDQFYAELKARWESMSQKGTIRLGVVTKDATEHWTWTSGAIISTPGTWAKLTGVLTIPAGAVQGRVWVSWQGSSAANEAVFVTDLVVRPAYATQSQITQLSGEIEQKINNGDFNTYKTQTANLIAEKVANKDFSTYQKQTADLISAKVATKDFTAYQATTAKAISSKVESSDFNTYKSQTADAILSKVSKKDANNVNLIPYSSNFSDSLEGWQLMAWGATDRKLLVTTHSFYKNGTGKLLYLNTAQNMTSAAGSLRFSVLPNTKYTFQFKAFASSNVVGANVYFLSRAYGSTKDYDTSHGLFTSLVTSPSHIDQYTVTFTTGANDNEGYIRVDNIGSSNGASSGLFFTELKMEPGDTATNYIYGGQDSMISQMSDDINLRVTKDGLLDQINLQAGKTLISSSGQLTLSGKNIYFDSANPVIIPSANIDTALVNKKLTAADISANTFTTNNGTFTVDRNGAITAKNMTLTGGTLTSPTINASKINSATINGTTINAGDINNNGNNTARFHPLTIDSGGSIRSYYTDNYFANSAKLYSGDLIISSRNMNANAGSNKFSGETAVLGGSSLTLSAGYTIGKDTDFTRPLVTEGEPGTTKLILSGITGITLKGDDQKIHFHGMYGDKQPKGITFTPYGNINGDEGSTTGNWYVGYNLANMTAQFGIDNLSKNTINLYRPTFVDEIGAVGNRLDNGRLLLHAVDGNAQMYILNDGSPAVASPTIYNRTYSNGSNVYVTSYGRIGRSTSASKYKLAIARSDDTVQADRLMTLKPASWNDKVATEKMAESLSNGEIPVEEEINLKRHYGLIAEDLRDAGLDEFLITGKNGQIEGIEYDRLWTVLIPKIKQLNNRINELERKTL